MKFRYAALAAIVPILLSTPSFSELPALGVQSEALADRPRVACDTIEQLKALYVAGKNDIFLIRPTMDKMNSYLGPNSYGGYACVVNTYPGVKVLSSEYLGPIVNPVGDAKLGMYAIHVDLSDVQAGNTIDFWVLYIDMVGESIGKSAPSEPLKLPGTQI